MNIKVLIDFKVICSSDKISDENMDMIEKIIKI